MARAVLGVSFGLYLIGVFLPLCTLAPALGTGIVGEVTRLLGGSLLAPQRYSVFTSIVALFVHAEWFLGGVITFASVVVPLTKYWLVFREASRTTPKSAGLFSRGVRFVSDISFLEVFVVAILVATFKQFPGGSRVLPEAGLVVFVCSLVTFYFARFLVESQRPASAPPPTSSPRVNQDMRALKWILMGVAVALSGAALAVSLYTPRQATPKFGKILQLGVKEPEVTLYATKGTVCDGTGCPIVPGLKTELELTADAVLHVRFQCSGLAAKTPAPSEVRVWLVVDDKVVDSAVLTLPATVRLEWTVKAGKGLHTIKVTYAATGDARAAGFGCRLAVWELPEYTLASE